MKYPHCTHRARAVWFSPTQSKIGYEYRQGYCAVNRDPFARFRSPQVERDHQCANGDHPEFHAIREGTPTMVRRVVGKSRFHSSTVRKNIFLWLTCVMACLQQPTAVAQCRVMKEVVAQVVLGIVISSACYGKTCSDPNLQQAVIGGDTIDGSVLLHHKALKFAQLRLFFSSGKTAAVGTTDKDGRFHIRNLRPDTYRLDVRGWGSTTIRISPNLNKLPNGQTLFDSVQLMDGGCISTMSVTN